MKKILLLAAAALMVSGASAQLQRSQALHTKAMPKAEFVTKPEAQKLEMHKATATNKLQKQQAPRKAGYIDGFYRRPAGGFTGFQFLENGAYGGGYYAPFLMLKPYAPYTYTAFVEGMSEENYLVWDYMIFLYDEQQGWYQDWVTVFDAGENLTVQYDWEYDECPWLYVGEGDGPVWEYQMGGREMSGTSDNPVPGAFYPSEVLAYPNFARAFGEEYGTVDLLVSSKTFCYGGRNGNQRYLMTYYSGCDPYGDNEDGWWFGKNGGRSNGMPIDGIAQAFEKPTHPYLLKQVVVETAILEVDGPVDMTCKVYKLEDGIPAYDPSQSVALPEVPGELIATGRASLTPETNETTDGFIIFTLYGEEDGIEYEITPTIDDAILVVVDGYNDEGMENLRDFSALISADDEADEGFGELAYIKYGLSDEDGNFSGDYVWAGLNNFFSNGSGGGLRMMTGMTIFITTDTPFLTYNWSTEDGKYTFPNEGGLMKKLVYQDATQTIYTESIEFFSWEPSVDDGWTLSCNGDDVPSWLNIELTDGEEGGEFNYEVLAEVTAEPLPAGTPYREAVVRFEFPGAYLDYTFMQGKKPDYKRGDVNGDGEVNIADVNAVISVILYGNDIFEGRADVNGDGETNIADVNEVIKIILYGDN